jgi:hypothetical protein
MIDYFLKKSALVMGWLMPLGGVLRLTNVALLLLSTLSGPSAVRRSNVSILIGAAVQGGGSTRTARLLLMLLYEMSNGCFTQNSRQAPPQK